MPTSILIMLALLAQTQSTSEPEPAPLPNYAEDIRCAGVLYAFQIRLQQRDPRQSAIQASLEAATARIDARSPAGEIDPAQVESDMQAAVNQGMTADETALTACTIEPTPVTLQSPGS